jgi:SAM-dependent methyltransferase
MRNKNFDEYAEDYDTILKEKLKVFGEETDYYAESKIRIIQENIRKSPARILEFGCGIGTNIRWLLDFFPNASVFGCDVSERSLEKASSRYQSVNFFPIKDDCIDPSGRFDVVLVANVFHHILPEQREETMKKLANYVADGGEIFIFEHNPCNPLTRYIVHICPFDKDVTLLWPKETRCLCDRAGFKVVSRKYILFFPSFLKKLRSLEAKLGWLPLGGQYYVHARKQ